jgi:hypothetical protein
MRVMEYGRMDDDCTPTYFIESDHAGVVEFARASAGKGDPIDMAVRLYYAVRDGIAYNPYCYTFEREAYRASRILEQGQGFCVQKAILLAAAARAVGIPCRVGYANVINHLTTKRLRELLRTDLFVFHGYNELFIGDMWVKATPAFNKSLCQKFGIRPLDFNGRDDSLFHPLDLMGRRHMEYVHDYGSFSDLPIELMIKESMRYYPHLAEMMKARGEEGDDRIKDPEMA